MDTEQHDRLYIFLDSSRKDPVQKLRYQDEDYLELFARTRIVPFVLGRLNLGKGSDAKILANNLLNDLPSLIIK